MNAIMLSIQPKYCELIASGKKTVEVRKTRPKLETPFKCYIYMTKDAIKHYYIDEHGYSQVELIPQKVIGEFICDKIYKIKNRGSRFMIDNDIALTNRIARESCLQFADLRDYMDKKDGYAWHISDLKIYDKPKELGEFKKTCKQYGADNPLCDDCIYFDCCRGVDYDESDCVVDGSIPLTRPPQSWCYVEELS